MMLQKIGNVVISRRCLMSKPVTKYEQMILDHTDKPLDKKTADAIKDVVDVEEMNEWASDLAEPLFEIVIDHVEHKQRNTFVEPDPDSEVGGTRNTLKGKQLYHHIKEFLKEYWMKTDE